MSLGEYVGGGTAVSKGIYHFNGGTTDGSGNGNNLTGTNLTSVPGILGSGAYSYNGSSSRAEISSNLGITGGNITMGGYVILNAQPNESVQCLCSQLSATNYIGYNILYYKFGTTYYLDFGRAKGNVGNQGANITSSTPILETGKKYHLLLTYDGTNVKGYINGIYKGQTAASGNGTGGSVSKSAVGCQFNSSGTAIYFLNGIADEIIYENYAWTQPQITKYISFSKGRFAIL